MSTFSCPIVNFELEKHPDADVLSIAKVKGWVCIVKTSDFLNESRGVYIPIDSVASKDHPLLGFLEGKKVKTKRLRGIISQGVLLPMSSVNKFLSDTYPNMIHSYGLGDDLSSLLKIKKWEPPVNNNLGNCNEIHEPALFDRYTDIENWKNYPNVIKEGEEVVLSEKIHGSSLRTAIINNEFYLGSHRRTLVLDPEKPTAWHKVIEITDSKNKITKMYDELKLNNPDIESVVVYGELYGKGVQDLTYGQGGYDLRIFDISINGQYISPDYRLELIEKYGFVSVPILYKGPFNLDLLDLRFGKDTISDSHVREGIVIEPVVPRYDRSLGRVKIKVVSEDYLMRKGGTDY